MYEKIIFAFVLHQEEREKKVRSESHSRVKLKASTDAFKLYANGFLLIDFVEKITVFVVAACMALYFARNPHRKKRQPRRRFRLHIKTVIMGVQGNYD